MRVGVATDHGGFDLKQEFVTHLRAAGHEVIDFGAHNLNLSDDYPDFVIPLAQAVAAGSVERGVAICASYHLHGWPDGGAGCGMGRCRGVFGSYIQRS